MSIASERVQRSRAAVLNAAVDLFVENGVSGVTVDGVVARSGVAKTTIYRHWESREALLLDVFRRFDHRFDPPPAELPPLERLRLLLEQLQTLLATPEWSRALPALLDVARRREEFAELHQPADHPGPLSSAIAAAVAAGDLPEDLTIGEGLMQLVGPLTMAAIFEPAALQTNFADRVVDRLAGRPG